MNDTKPTPSRDDLLAENKRLREALQKIAGAPSLTSRYNLKQIARAALNQAEVKP